MDFYVITLFSLVLLFATISMYVGAEWFVDVLALLRVRWGISAAFAGTVIAVASTSPEIIMNITSASRDVGDIGLGNVLGSNILNIPILVLVAYIASKKYYKCALPVERETVVFHALPYLAFIGLLGFITLGPEPLYGFQLYDAGILLAAYVVYTLGALLKGKSKGSKVKIPTKKAAKGAIGFSILAVGAYLAIISSEQLAEQLFEGKEYGLLVTGLFIAAIASSLPEALASWHAVKSKESVAAVTSVIDDNIISITLAMIPLTFVISAITHPELYVISLFFVLLTAVEYTIFAYTGYHFTFSEVVTLFITYLLYIAIVVFMFV